MRAMEPVDDGYIERGGVKVHYEVFGTGSPTILLLPTWSIIPSRRWKMQVPYLARHHRVVTFDGRGCGRSDRPSDPAAYADHEYAADAVAVLDATGTEQALLVGVSMGGGYALRIATSYPDRVAGAVFVAPAVLLADRLPDRVRYSFDEVLDTEEGWAKYNKHYWLRDWPNFARFFFSQVLTEPHSTKPREDAAGWAVTDTDPETILLIQRAPYLGSREDVLALAASVRCPCIVVHGDKDAILDVSGGRRLAAAIGCEFVLFEGSGHVPDARDPVRFNLLVHEFANKLRGTPPERERRWTRALNRKPKVLYLSSPIGLGHARRDLAIARELRALRPDVEVEWLTQHPVTAMLEASGEQVHPACRLLANESAHIEDECADHDLHVFQAYRRMDEILCANFGVLHDVLDESAYDLVIGDEAWETDYYLHENPELKRTPFVWMTDFVGWLPMPSGGSAEELLTTDYNAEMIEHIARYPRLRDLSLFVGDAEDVVPHSFGTGLPEIKDWTRDNFEFVGYVSGLQPVPASDRDGVRRELGYSGDEQVCIVTVGGSGVGAALLNRVAAAYPEVHRLLPELRMVLVAGPRIDPRSLPSHPGLEVRAFVPDLWKHLAVCDVAVVQGGLTTTMELAANQRPFVYVPLRNHFEQQLHVRHRLDRYRAGRYADYDDLQPDALAVMLADELARPAQSLPVASDGAARAAARIGALL